MVTGAAHWPMYAYVVAAKYPSTSRCTPITAEGQVDGYIAPAGGALAGAVARGEEPLSVAHVDGSAVRSGEPEIAAELLAECAAAHIVMEMEIGVVGGEEDGVVGRDQREALHTPEDALATAEAVGSASTAGTSWRPRRNVHGVSSRGHVKLPAPVLREIQEAVGQKTARKSPSTLVFHGGSGSSLEEIREGIFLRRGQENVDTVTQYAFTGPSRPHVQELQVSSRWTRGRQTRGVRPRSWGQGRRGRHGRARHARLRDLLSPAPPRLRP